MAGERDESNGGNGPPSNPPRTQVEGGQSLPQTQLEPGTVVPPTSLEGASLPPTSLEGDSDPEGGTHVNLPAPLREEYEALEDIGSGGEGDLLLVRHRESGRRRVVKIYRGDRERDERALELISRASSDHVVAIHLSGKSGGRWWEVMEYCEYGSLADLIVAEGPQLPTERIVEIVADTAAALEHLHGLNIPHRDLKPGNILIRSQEPFDLVLADFGLARVIDATKEMHSRVLSAGYASPQAINGAVSPAMDWWSLGMIVAEMALGRSPFEGENGERFADLIIFDWIASRPIELSGIADPRLRRLCEGLTRRDDRAGHRWGAAEVEAWLAGEDPQVVAEAEAQSAVSASPFPFVDPTSKRTRPFTDPVELATAMAVGWDEALAVLGGSAQHRADQRALRNFLRSLGLAEAEQILGEQDDAEERLTRLLVQLDPRIAPTFRGYSVDRRGLLGMTESGSEGAASALEAIFAERVLLNYSRSQGHEDLADLDASWHEASSHFEEAMNLASQGAHGAVLGDDAERAAASAMGRRSILAALIDEGTRNRLRQRAKEAAGDRLARKQEWFAKVAEGGLGD